MGTRHTIGLVMFASAAVACAAKKVDSGDLRTRGLGASIRVDTSGDERLHVYATLTAGSPTDSASPLVELSNGDGMTVTAGGTTTELRLEKSVLSGAPSYQADIAEPQEGTSVDIALLRQSDTSAPKSSCFMPQSFEVLSPAVGSEVAVGQELVVQWENPSGTEEITLSLDGECFSTAAIQVMDTGAATFGRDAVKIKPSCATACRPPAKTCDALLRIGKSSDGVVDPAFGKGGSIECVQARSVALVMRDAQ